MKKREIRNAFFDELEKRLPEVEWLSATSVACRKRWVPVLAFSATAALTMTALSVGLVLALGEKSGALLSYAEIVDHLTAESQCERSWPDFKTGLRNQDHMFFKIEQKLDLDDGGRKIGLYLPKDKARSAEKDCGVSDLLSAMVFGGKVFYLRACDYLDDLGFQEFSKGEAVPFENAGSELVGIYYETQFTVYEEIISGAIIEKEGIFLRPFLATHDADSVTEHVRPYALEEIYESRVDLSTESSMARFNPYFSSYDYGSIGEIRGDSFVYNSEYYSSGKDYSVPELDSVSKLISTDNIAYYSVPYVSFKEIIRSRASYYRDPVTLSATASCHECPSGTLPDGTRKWLVGNRADLEKTGIDHNSFDKYGDTYFNGKSLIVLSQRDPKYSVGSVSFIRLDRRGDELEINLAQTKSYETRERELLWTIEVSKSELEGKSQGGISLDTETIEPDNPDALLVFSEPQTSYGYKTLEGSVTDLKLLSFGINADAPHAPYDSTILFEIESPYLPKDDGPYDNPDYYWQIEKLVRNGNVVGVYLKIPKNWEKSTEKHTVCRFHIYVYSDFLQAADKIRIDSLM